jgi:hypothetical protein
MYVDPALCGRVLAGNRCPSSLDFLDIDGVLHRAENGSLEFMPVLDHVLTQCPQTGIILSTNWRTGVPREMVLSHFPAGIRDRIAGLIPIWMGW